MTEKKELQKADAQPLAMQQKTVIDFVAGKVNEFVTNGQLELPSGYSPHNAMKSAWLMMQAKPELMLCTNDSIANAMLNMAVQGLNPGKNQCYFIAYGKSLTCQRSYFGSMAVSKMVDKAIGDFFREVVYEKDVFKYSILNGKKTITAHEQKIENIDKGNIRAAYCVVVDKSGNVLQTEIMTIDEIKQAWKQSSMKPVGEDGKIKSGSVHDKFTADMALKTVINRVCKGIINSSDDGSLLLATIKENEDMVDRVTVESEVSGKANTGPVLKITGEGATEAPKETTAEVPGEDPKHPGYDLCCEERKCEKYDNLNDCPGANDTKLRNNCNLWKPESETPDVPVDVPCPNDGDTLTAWTVCKGCSELNGCPAR